MKLSLLIVALLFVTAAAAMALPGQSWILPIDHLNGGGWIEHPGAGYGGVSAWEGNTMDGVRRVYWEMLDPTIPVSTQMYSIEFFVPTDAQNLGWQPIESQLRGVDGEIFPNDPQIPWAGMWGTNHQYIGAEGGTPGDWKAAGSGPHTPEDSTFNAGANGTAMWLHQGSWLYAKWDYGWAIDHEWSAIRITQVTPEPSGFLALLAGFPALALLRRKR